MTLDDDRPLGEEEPLSPVGLRDEERLLVIFAYLGPLAFVSLAAARNDFIRWQARQGLLLSTTALLTFVMLRIPHVVFFKIWPFLGQIFMTVEILIGFGFFLVCVLCIVRGLEGNRFKIPFLADLVDRF